MVRAFTTVASGLLLALVAGGCGVEPSSPPLADDMILVGAGACSGQRRATGLNGPTIVYLNFTGQAVSKVPYNEDAAKNTSFVGSGTVPPFSGDAATKANVVSIAKGLFAPFNITFVTTRPTSGDYDMIVIGGTPAAIGVGDPNRPANTYLGGIAPLDCGNKMPRNVAFVFSDTIKMDVFKPYAEAVAQSLAHEAGHTYGLPHSNDGCDIMSYGSCAGPKAFLNKTMGMQDPASSDPLQDMRCGMSSMNSYQLLLATLGKAGPLPPDTQAPSVGITAPANGATVPGSVIVKAAISDDRTVSRAELRLDGTLKVTLTQAPWDFPVSLASGAHTLVVDAFDAAGNKGSASITVSVDGLPGDTQPPKVSITAPAQNAEVGSLVTVSATVTDDQGVSRVDVSVDNVLKGSKSAAPWTFKLSLDPGLHTVVVDAFDAAGNQGSAVLTLTVSDAPVPSQGEYGAPCEWPSDCKTGVCVVGAGGAAYCSQQCTPDADDCPGGTQCIETSDEGYFVCVKPLPADDPGAGLEADADAPTLKGGCSVGGSASSGLFPGALLALLALLRRRPA